MKISLCTISFRHTLVSFEELVHWAGENDFQGIELWGVHARGLHVSRVRERLASERLNISMLSDYFALEGDEGAAVEKARRMARLARELGARKVRTFAGRLPSAQVGADAWRDHVRRLRTLVGIFHDEGLELLVETHPHTLADSLESTLRLLHDVGGAGLGINFDVLHVWESGADPISALEQLRPAVRHFHFKNVRSRAWLDDFLPANVYSAAGSRGGMVPLFDGACDFEPFIDMLQEHVGPEAEASLEWFGDDVRQVLHADRRALRRLERARRERPAPFPTP